MAVQLCSGYIGGIILCIAEIADRQWILTRQFACIAASKKDREPHIAPIAERRHSRVRPSAQIAALEALWKELGLSKKKHTTDDMMFTVETVSCLGACGLAPTLTVNDEVHPKMTPEKAIELLNELRGETV